MRELFCRWFGHTCTTLVLGAKARRYRKCTRCPFIEEVTP